MEENVWFVSKGWEVMSQLMWGKYFKFYYLVENNPDVQDLSIKVSFEINDKNVFEFEDNIKK